MELVPKLPPISLRGPRAMPLLGATGNVLAFFRDPIGVLLRLHRTYGNVAPFVDRNAAWVAVFGAEHNQAVLSDAKLFHNFSEIPLRLPEGSAPLRLNDALTSMNGEVHRRHRRLLMPAFSRPAIASYRDGMVSVARRLLDRWPASGTFDVSEKMIELTLCVAMQCLYGLDATRQADELGRLSMEYLAGMLSIGALLFPFRLPGTPYARFLDVSERLEARIRALIAERRAHPTDGRDVLSLLLNARDEDGGGLTDSELVGQAAVLLVAAHETTSHTLSWTLFLLSQHPEVYAALLAELQSTLHGEAPTPDDVARLPVLDGVVKESMRLLPATPFLFFRRSTGPFELGGQQFPERTTLVLSPLVSHRAPNIFPEPLRFRPERWKGPPPSTYEYIPFGAGPRMCIGAGFATLALRVLLAMIVQKFRMELVPGANVSRQVRGITLGPRHGLPMRVFPQDGRFARPSPVRGDIHELVELRAS